MPNLSTRYGNTVGHTIVRFELLENLTPGDAADAKVVGWNGTTYEKLEPEFDLNLLLIEVNSTFFRSFGLGSSQTGEAGWALFHGDSGQWEIISMEGSLMRHGKALTTLDNNTTGVVVLFSNVEGTETSSGVSVFANNFTGSTIDANSTVFIWFEPWSGVWYVVGGAGAGKPGKIVSPYAEEANEDTCLWMGKIAELPDLEEDEELEGYCSDPFENMTDCWLLLLDPDGGSFAENHDKLVVGEYFLGTYVATFGVEDDDKLPVYAIRRGGGDLLRFELTEDLAQGESAEAGLLTWQDDDWKTDDNPTITVWDMTEATWQGKGKSDYERGYRGWCRKMPDSSKYEIVWMENRARWIRTTAGPVFDAVEEFHDGRDPDPRGLGINISRVFPTLRTVEGSQSISLFAPDLSDGHGEYRQILTTTKAGAIAVELEEDAGGNDDHVPAQIIDFWGAGLDILPPNADLTVGIKNDARFFPNALKDSTGIALYDSIDDVYRPVLFNQQALLYRARLTQDMAPADAEVEIDSLVAMTGFPFGQVDDAITEANNPYGLTGKNGDDVLLCWNDSIGELDIVGPTKSTIFTAEVTQTSIASQVEGTVKLSNGSFVQAKNLSDVAVFRGDTITVYINPPNYWIVAKGAGTFQASAPVSAYLGQGFNDQFSMLLPGDSEQTRVRAMGPIVKNDRIGIYCNPETKNFWAFKSAGRIGQVVRGDVLGGSVDTSPVSPGDYFRVQINLVDPDSIVSVFNATAGILYAGDWVTYFQDDSDGIFYAVKHPADILVFNVGSGICGPFSPMEVVGTRLIDGSGLNNPDTRFAIEVQKPSSTFHRSYLVNGGLQIAASDFGWAQNGTLLRLAVQSNPANGETWGPSPGIATAIKGNPGFTVLGKDLHTTDSGLTVAAATQDPMLRLLVKTTAHIENNTATGTSSSAAYQIYTGTSGSETNGGWTTVPAAYNRSGFLANNTWAWLLWQNNAWEICGLPDSSTVIGKLASTLSYGSNATVTVYSGTGGGESTTVKTITAWDWLMSSGATSIASGKKVICKLINGVWYVIEAECP